VAARAREIGVARVGKVKEEVEGYPPVLGSAGGGFPTVNFGRRRGAPRMAMVVSAWGGRGREMCHGWTQGSLEKAMTHFIEPAELVRRNQAGGKRRCTGGAHEQRGRRPSGVADGWARLFDFATRNQPTLSCGLTRLQTWEKSQKLQGGKLKCVL
jgi:hypothetical protein